MWTWEYGREANLRTVKISFSGEKRLVPDSWGCSNNEYESWSCMQAQGTSFILRCVQLSIICHNQGSMIWSLLIPHPCLTHFLTLMQLWCRTMVRKLYVMYLTSIVFPNNKASSVYECYITCQMMQQTINMVARVSQNFIKTFLPSSFSYEWIRNGILLWHPLSIQ